VLQCVREAPSYGVACAAVYCSVLQCVAVWNRDPKLKCCFVLQRVAVCCSVLQCFAECCCVLQCVIEAPSYIVAACCSVLQRFAVCCSVLQFVTVCNRGPKL